MASGLSKIEIITSFTKFTELQSELGHLGVRGMTVSQVLGCGIQKGSAEYAVEENEEIVLLPKQLNMQWKKTKRLSFSLNSRLLL